MKKTSRTQEQAALIQEAQYAIMDILNIDLTAYNGLCFELGMQFAQAHSEDKDFIEKITSGEVEGFWAYWSFYYALNDLYILQKHDLSAIDEDFYLSRKEKLVSNEKLHAHLSSHIRLSNYAGKKSVS